MNITKETVIGDLVAQDYRTASVFKSSKIDFCCNGNRTIEDACEQKQIDCNILIAALAGATSQKKDVSIDYHNWPLDLLTDYIEKKHHRYVTVKIQEIIPFLEKIVRVHGDHHPELEKVEQLFKASAEALTQHMKKEELVLFPYVKKMVAVQSSNTTVQASFGTVQQPVGMMMREHDGEGERFREIAALTNNYTPPDDACNSYKVTFALLQEFEEDLHLHIHLENNILFPKSIAMEATLVNV